MSIYFSKDVVYVNSLNRNSGTSSNFTIDLSDQIRPVNQYDRISLLKFSCPKSYYLINNTNNTFIINELATPHTVTLTNGNYSFTELTTEINTQVASSGVAYTYDFQAITSLGKYKIVITNNAGVQPSFDFSRSNLYAIVGFDKSTYISSGNVLYSVNIVNLQLTSTILLMSEVVEKSILSVIIPNTSDYSTISYIEYNADLSSKLIARNNFASANFYLVDGNTGSNLDLNGLNFEFTFAIYKWDSHNKYMLNKSIIADQVEN